MNLRGFSLKRMRFGLSGRNTHAQTFLMHKRNKGERQRAGAELRLYWTPGSKLEKDPFYICKYIILKGQKHLINELSYVYHCSKS